MMLMLTASCSLCVTPTHAKVVWLCRYQLLTKWSCNGHDMIWDWNDATRCVLPLQTGAGPVRNSYAVVSRELLMVPLTDQPAFGHCYRAPLASPRPFASWSMPNDHHHCHVSYHFWVNSIWVDFGLTTSSLVKSNQNVHEHLFLISHLTG